MSKHEPRPSFHNLAYIEDLRESFERDPFSVLPEWRASFALNGAAGAGSGNAGEPVDPTATRADRRSTQKTTGARRADAVAQERLHRIVRAYRVRGHVAAQLDPLERERAAPPELAPGHFGFTAADLDREFWCESLCWRGPLTLREIVARLRNTYCRFIGVEYMHIGSLATREWLQRRMETTQNRIDLSREIQHRILTRLTDAVIFEEFVRRKFPGAKTFSLEGCESLVPLLELAIEKAGAQGVREIVMGMAHRGRLNVLVNIMGKPASQIFHEFADDPPEAHPGGGDVKYHLGHSHDWETTAGHRVHLSLCFNPSHLEFVDPVALGRVRAKQDRVNDTARETCLGLLIHGDAAFAGEGIVQETLNLSQLAGYTTGGTLHVIVNNQIGFTTPPEEGRSCRYATDVARMFDAPIFHVNGEVPEAVAQCLHVAMEFRKEFKRDVVIDMYGYRRLGHNEADEPSFTQPAMYGAIAGRPGVRECYLEHLLGLNGLSREEAGAIAEQRREHLEAERSAAGGKGYQPPGERRRGIWARSRFHGGAESTVEAVNTGVRPERLRELLRKLIELPPQFTPHPKVKRFREHWREMAEGSRPLDWSAAEALAFATLAREGVRVRLSGQDSARGTFSQRHAVLHDHRGEGTWTALQHVASDQAPVEMLNSPLSEAGVLGFEYGYSLDCPDGLILWEAQFGDFANAAQVIIDQFIASAEQKWRRLSGLVLLLPHGFEGMGPEHASARLERFLELCAGDNLQVAAPSTPAQYFHVLRRQALSRWRKPLVLLTPKSLLRHADCVSSLNELAFGSFHRVLPDVRETDRPRRVLLCSGKIYFELARHRRDHERNDVAIARIEQFHPWRDERLVQLLDRHPGGTRVVWVQEEPENMGAWGFLRLRLGEVIAGRWPLSLVARPASASPATGSASTHKLEQARLIDAAFADDTRGIPRQQSSLVTTAQPGISRDRNSRHRVSHHHN